MNPWINRFTNLIRYLSYLFSIKYFKPLLIFLLDSNQTVVTKKINHL